MKRCSHSSSHSIRSLIKLFSKTTKLTALVAGSMLSIKKYTKHLSTLDYTNQWGSKTVLILNLETRMKIFLFSFLFHFYHSRTASEHERTQYLLALISRAKNELAPNTRPQASYVRAANTLRRILSNFILDQTITRKSNRLILSQP